jgi:hypothetical protein
VVLRLPCDATEPFSGFAERAGTTVEGMLAERTRTGTLLKRLPTLDEVANVAAFVASDRASAMTGAIANLTCHHPGRGAAGDRDRSAAVQQTARGKRQHFSRQRSSCSSPTTTSRTGGTGTRTGRGRQVAPSPDTGAPGWLAVVWLSRRPSASWPGGWLRPARALVAGSVRKSVTTRTNRLGCSQ